MRDDRDAVAALIDRIVSSARIPRRRDREALRRELWTHFEEAGAAGLDRFGSDATVADAFRTVYRTDFIFFYAAKLVVSIAACVAAALVIQVLVNLRFELTGEAWRLAPGFSRMAALSVVIVLGLVAAWEFARRPLTPTRAVAAVGAYSLLSLLMQAVYPAAFSALITATILVALGSLCSKPERWPARLSLACVAFGATMYVTHARLSIVFGFERAAIAGAIYAAVWASTLAILGRSDHLFDGLFSGGGPVADSH